MSIKWFGIPLFKRLAGQFIIFTLIFVVLLYFSIWGPYIILLIIPANLVLTAVYKIYAVTQKKSPRYNIPLEDLNRYFLHCNLFLPIFFAGLLAPFSGLTWYFLQEKITLFLSYSFTFMGVSGIAFPLIWTAMDLSWRLEQLRQIRNLATSPAGAAALGFSEFRGTARTKEGGDLILGQNRGIHSWISPFYLEDKTGRILIDPEGAHIRQVAGPLEIWKSFYKKYQMGWVQLLGGGLCEVILQRGPGGERELKDGDTVYVLGNVEVNEKAPSGVLDSARLVVRRNRRERRPSWWARLLLNADYHHKDRYYDIFYLTNKDEDSARKAIIRNAAGLLTMTVPWVALSVLSLHLGLGLR